MDTWDPERYARFAAERPQSTARLERAVATFPRGVPMSWMDDLYEHAPIWVSHGSGAYFWDVDGHEYLDMFVADMSAFCGHAPEPVVTAVSRRMAAGNQFLLPSDEAVPLGEHLAQRYRMPQWQFTLSASQANTEVIRIARKRTGREIVLVFDGKYHGHLEPTLVVLDDGEVVPEFLGLSRDVTGGTRMVPFNDVSAVERGLADREVALVLTEPAMTNAGFLLPEPAFHDALRRVTRATGTLLAIDETHSLVTSYAGLTTEWGLEPDFLTLGKAIAAGVPLGAYGMTHELAAEITPPDVFANVSGAMIGEVATGGTLFANALSVAAGLVAMTEVLTQDAFDRTAELGDRLGAGLRRIFNDAGLAWSVVQHGSHAAYFFTPEAPRNAAESRAADDPALRALFRVFLANRGVWESGWWLGPTVSVAHTAADVDRYLDAVEELTTVLT